MGGTLSNFGVHFWLTHKALNNLILSSSSTVQIFLYQTGLSKLRNFIFRKCDIYFLFLIFLIIAIVMDTSRLKNFY